MKSSNNTASTNNIMKSWADEQDDSSSEEEEEEKEVFSAGYLPGMLKHEGDGKGGDNTVNPYTSSSSKMTTTNKDFSALLVEPPYTAYLGNLPQDSIRSSDDLGREVERLLYERQCVLAKRLTGARLMMDKVGGGGGGGSNTTTNNYSRGYGYVEFETREELLEFLRLPNPQLCKRNIKVDVANVPRTSNSRSNGGSTRGGGRDSSGRQYYDRRESGSGRIDGSQFMGGRYSSMHSSSGNLGASSSGGSGVTPTAVMKRADSSASYGSSRAMIEGSGNTTTTTTAADVPKQRPSLKLLARTKPLDGSEQSSIATAQSSIFGGAKPRDETKFVAATAVADANVAETKIDLANNARQDLTSDMAKMDVSINEVGDTTTSSDHQSMEKSEIGDATENNHDTKEASVALPGDTPESNGKDDKEKSKRSYERKDSRGGGGRARSGRGRGGGKNRENNEDGKREGKGENTRKSGRGEVERSAGGRGRGGEGRKNNNERRNSKSNKNGSSNTTSGKSNTEGSNKGKSGGDKPLTAVEGGEVGNIKSLPTMPTANEAKKGPPKKVNSFAAFMDDSDSD